MSSNLKKVLNNKIIKLFLIPLLINFLLFLLFISFVSAKYESNDDISMEGIASGEYTGTPNEYLIYISYMQIFL